jgi:hypothetical protein
MIVVKLQGGLGNQMFQYAAGRCLSEKYKTDLKLDLSFLLDRTPREDFVFRDYDLDIFDIHPKLASSSEIVSFGKPHRVSRTIYSFKRVINSKLPEYLCEYPFGFDPRFFRTSENAYLYGYWQSERYFKAIESIIRNEFTFCERLDSRGIEMSEQIESVNSVCLNVRRGDYVTSAVASQHHGVCDEGYFAKGVEVVASHIRSPHIFIFSDDIEWCHDHLSFDYPYTIVSHDFAGKKFGQYLHLMSLCKHFIIPNSSFAWWAAWLNSNPGKMVVAPIQWYKNPKMNTRYLMPEKWIRV